MQQLLQQRHGLQVELLGMTTRGDQILDRTLSKVGGKGLFVKELETALEDGRAELAVHSLKDVPMELPDGFVLAAVLEREDPRDAFVSNHHASIDELPHGALVGTSSLRRVVQLRNLRPDLRVEPLRGNLDTRLRKLDEGGYDAIVLAAAGLKRLGLASAHRVGLRDRARCCRARGRVRSASRCAATPTDLCATARRNWVDRATQLAVTAERAVSRALGGSCSMPLAAHASWDGDALALRVALGHPERTEAPLLRQPVRRRSRDADEAEALGAAAAAGPARAGAAGYLAAASR